MANVRTNKEDMARDIRDEQIKVISIFDESEPVNDLEPEKPRMPCTFDEWHNMSKEEQDMIMDK